MLYSRRALCAGLDTGDDGRAGARRENSKDCGSLLAAAGPLGATTLARSGGAQAIDALAYKQNDCSRGKLLGPGNQNVTAAKQLVSSYCAIDLQAGPTEAVVLCNQGNPRWIAADLVAQAEHAPDTRSFLATTSGVFARKVQREVILQLTVLPKNHPAQLSTRKTGAILLARSKMQACEFVNHFAPEHLSLPDQGEGFLDEIHSAGTVFQGPLNAQPFGDYASGSNHVLPTGGWARQRGDLSAPDFVKCVSVQTTEREGHRRPAGDLQSLVYPEGLLAHANAVAVRR